MEPSHSLTANSMLDLYKYIPPPLPLIFDGCEFINSARKKPDIKRPVISRNDPAFGLHEQVIEQQAPGFLDPEPTTRLNRKIYNEALFLQILQMTVPKIETPCTCDISSKAFLELQNVLPSNGIDIPLLYRDYSDSLFSDPQQLHKYKFVYVRHRPCSFKALLNSILDPTIPYFRDRESIGRLSACALHSEAHSRRQMMQSASLAVSEFAFDSQFEGGNLDKVVWVKEGEFNLFLTADTNTRGHTQWFYFAVRNAHKDKSVVFNIMNFSKNGSLFSKGMRPAVFSLQRMKKHGTKWTKGGFDVRYWRNSIPKVGRTKITHYYTLTFTYTFQYDNDTVYFAYSEPYLYTKLRQFLDRQRASCSPGVVWEESVLCKSLGGLNVPLIKIREAGRERAKRLITVTARVHPGESVGSFMCEGFLSFICSSKEEAVRLRRQFNIVVVPMLNPDGVVAGNSRTSLTGVDLNRKWKEPLADLYPTIAAVKQICRESSAFIDLHGHSKKDFCFMYGNHFPRRNPDFWRVRFMPLLLSKLTESFSYADTRFFTEKCHSQSARAVLFTQYGLVHSFTLEASFYGCIAGGSRKEFNCNDYRIVGSKLGTALAGLFKFEPQLYASWLTYDSINELAHRFKDELERKSRHARLQQRSTNHFQEPLSSTTTDLVQTLVLLNLGEDVGSSSDEEEAEETSGSDSEPSFDNLEETELENVTADIRKIVAESKPVRLAREPVEAHFKPKDVLDHFLEKFSGGTTSRLEDLRAQHNPPSFMNPIERSKSILATQNTHRMWTQRLLSSKRKLRKQPNALQSSSPTPERSKVSSLRRNYGSFETYMANLQKKANMTTKFPPLTE